MADGKTLAKAYVQMIPTTKGFKSALLSETEGSMDEAGSGLGNRLGSAIKGALAAAGIGMALKSVIGAAVSEGAALEQSIGGIKTLFGTADMSLEQYAQSVGQSVDQAREKYESLSRAETAMLQYAKNAYKDAGLSANDYMSQASSFAASLVSSLGGDTEAAAQVANMAMIDMSDNANKMGTDMESLQNAYQGFAKQNYTMLDNLKLGYGGTKEEMARLLKDAEALTGVKYDINNLGDVYNAIHAVQEKLHITGTTAQEASETFSGSFQMMKSAWQNVLGYIATGNVDEAFESLRNAMNSSITFVFDNALPMIGRFVSQIPSLLTEGFWVLGDRLREHVIEGSGEFITTLTGSLPALMSTIAYFITGIGEWIKFNWPAIRQMARDAMQAFIDGLKKEWPEASDTIDALLPILEKIPQAIMAWKIGKLIRGQFTMLKGALSTLSSAFAPLTTAFTSAGGGLAGLKAAFVAAHGPAIAIAGGIALIVGAFISLWQNNEEFRNNMIRIWNEIVGKVQEFCQGIVDRINQMGFEFEDITQVLQAVWQGFCDFMVPIFEGVWQAVSDTLTVVFDVILALVDTFAAAFSGDWDEFWAGIQTIVDAVWQFIGDTINNVIQIITGCVQTFLSWFGVEWDGNLQGIQETWNGIWDGIKLFLDGAVVFIRGIIDGFIALFNGDWDGFCANVSTAWDGLWNGVKQFASDIWGKIKEAGRIAFDGIRTTITGIWDNLKKKLKEGWDGIKQHLSNVWNGIKTTASTIFNNIKDAITKPFQEAYDSCKGIWDWLTGRNPEEQKQKYERAGRVTRGPQENAVGGIFTQPTFFPDFTGQTGGNIVGEAGAEAVLPLSGFYRQLNASITNGYTAVTADPRLDRAVELLEVIAEKSIAVYINKNRLVSEIYEDIDEKIQRHQATLSFVGGIR